MLLNFTNYAKIWYNDEEFTRYIAAKIVVFHCEGFKDFYTSNYCCIEYSLLSSVKR